MVDNTQLYLSENLHPSLVGMVVDYMTRLCLGAAVYRAFAVSLAGARAAHEQRYAARLVDNVVGLDDRSLACACQLVGYDVCYRRGMAFYRPVEQISPDQATLFNLRTMIRRSLHLIEEYGPVRQVGFTFDGGYTATVDRGDGDFLTRDTLWDFKVSRRSPTSAHTLQLVAYYLLGIHSVHQEFSSITKLGIFNPRLNNAYLIDLVRIDQSTLRQVEQEVMGYP